MHNQGISEPSKDPDSRLFLDALMVYCIVFSNINKKKFFLGGEYSSSTLRISDVNDEELF